MKSRKRDRKKKFEGLSIFIRGVKVWHEICPQVLFYDALNCIAGGLSPYFPLYMSALLVNELAGECEPGRLLTLAAVTVFGTFVISMLTRILNGKREVWVDAARTRIELYMACRQNRMQYEHMENPEVTLLREEINAISTSVGGGIIRILYQFPDLAGYALDMAVSASVTFSMFRVMAGRELTGFLAFVNSPASAVLLVILILANVILSSKNTAAKVEKITKAVEHVAENNMSIKAYRGIRGEDVAIFNMKEVILQQWQKTILRPEWIANFEKINVKYAAAATLQKAVLNGAVFIMTAAKAFIGVFGIGNYILYSGTVNRFVNAVSRIAGCISELRENNKYLEKFFRFLDLPDDMYHGTLAVEKRQDIDYEIEFRNVSFRYPGTENWALRHVNMKFHVGDKLAIVGENGSGKTTFIKLLCRLYDPTEGEILLNGIDITRYRYEEYMALFSVVFQDYKLFAFSLAANVSCSLEYDRDRVEECLRQAGFGDRLAGLEQGVETVVGRGYENDGIDLSGGEEQKIALARALYKDAPFVVLDEPTAALDPIAEAAVYESFRELTKDKTAVFISHRLSSCRFCDDIAVFNHGELVQRGSHDRLAGEKGKYRELWNAQAQYYGDNLTAAVQRRDGEEDEPGERQSAGK